MRHFIGKAGYRGLLAVVMAIFLLIGQAAFAADDTTTSERDTQYLKSVMDMIKDQYGGPMTEGQVVQGAMSGMFSSLDPYTTFYTPAEEQSFMSNISGTYAGIGISMELSGNYILVSKVFSGSPAEKAGIIQGDRIATADGKSIAGNTLVQAAAAIMGETGTKVKLGIIRSGKSDTLNIEVTRGTVKINPVTYEIRNGIGYIKLDMFNENTDEFMSKALKEMDKDKVTKLILDLRSNPGGEVGQAVAVAQNFVPKGLITKLDYKSEGYTDIEYNSYLDKAKYKLAVLVNENSASASEIVTGAIQDTGAGKIIGTKTFGKAKFQGILPILTPEAYAVYEKQFGEKIVNAYDLVEKHGVEPTESEIEGYAKITLGYYYTPKGRMIDGTGLKPDIAVADPPIVSDIDVTSVQKLTGTVKLGLNNQGVDVYNAEEMLKLLGYTVDAADSKLDSKTFSAIKKFQKASKLYANGVLDFTTQKALNNAFDKALLKLDKQYAKAVEVLTSK